MVIPLTHEGHNIDSVKLAVLQDIQSSTIREKISTMHFTKTAKDLGTMIGPAAELQAWDEPIQKYISRSKRWSQLSIGPNWSIKMYNVFVFSVLSFMAQFYEPPPELGTIQRRGECAREAYARS